MHTEALAPHRAVSDTLPCAVSVADTLLCAVSVATRYHAGCPSRAVGTSSAPLVLYAWLAIRLPLPVGGLHADVDVRIFVEGARHQAPRDPRGLAGPLRDKLSNDACGSVTVHVPGKLRVVCVRAVHEIRAGFGGARWRSRCPPGG